MLHYYLAAVLVFSCSTLGISQTRDDADGFKLVKSNDDIFIYERWVKFPKSNPPVDAREVKGVFHVRAGFDQAMGLVRNEKRIKEWQSHVSKFKVYPLTDSTWYEYSYHEIPWPVADQDHFLVYKITKQNSDTLFLTFESIEHKKYAPVSEDADRMKLSGSWLFEQKNGRLKVTYSILSWPSHIPRIFTDPVIRSNMMSTIKSYIRIVEEADQ